MNKSMRSRMFDGFVRWGDATVEQQQWYARHPRAKFASDFLWMFFCFALADCLWFDQPEQSFRFHVGDIALRATLFALIAPIGSRLFRKETRASSVDKPSV